MQGIITSQTGIADKSLGYVQLLAAAVDAGVLLSAAPIPDGTAYALIRPEAQAIRYRDDNIMPTTTVGYPIPAGEAFFVTVQQLPQVKLISQVAGAIVNVLFYSR